MNLETIKAKLTEAEFSALKEHVADLTGQRDAARNESIEKRKALKTELEQLKSERTKLFEKLGLDDDASIDDLPSGKGQAEAARQFETRIKRLERDLADANKAKGETEAKFAKARVEAVLSKSLVAHDFIDADLVGEFVRARSRLEGDEVVFQDGDKVSSVADGIAALVAARPSLLKAKGAGGSGHVPGTGGAGGQKNPYAKDSFNLTEQLRISAENPALAAQMKAAAGA